MLVILGILGKIVFYVFGSGFFYVDFEGFFGGGGGVFDRMGFKIFFWFLFWLRIFFLSIIIIILYIY